MPASTVWHQGAPVFRDWAKKYRSERSFEPSKAYSKKTGFAGDKTSFKSRYPKKDFGAIAKTLEFLKSFDRSLIQFVGDMIARFHDKEDIVCRISCALFLATYDVELPPNTVLQILDRSFDEYYNHWLRHKTTNKKRLWAAFRDYVKVGSPGRKHFLNGLAERNYPKASVNIFSRFGTELPFLNQLELPGDVWNNNRIFVENFLMPLGLELGVRISDKDVDDRTVNDRVREICIAAQGKGCDIYPEQFDVTFEFVPTMCANPDNADAKLCRTVCPFGTGDKFFLSYHPESRFCLTNLMLTGGFSDCNAAEHDTFKSDTGRKMCKGYTKNPLF